VCARSYRQDEVCESVVVYVTCVPELANKRERPGKKAFYLLLFLG
jgi:hypothetical protein